MDAMDLLQGRVPVAGQYITPQLCPEDFGTTVQPALRAAASAFSMSFFGCLRSLIMPHGVASCQHRINGHARAEWRGSSGLVDDPAFSQRRFDN